MDYKKGIIICVIVIICLASCLAYVVSTNISDNENAAGNNTTSSVNITNNTTNVSANSISQDNYDSASAEYQDPHPDWVCEGDTWYSVQMDNGNYALYDKESGRLIGTGDMPDRHGYHDPAYLEEQSSTVKYRSDGEYYEG